MVGATGVRSGLLPLPLRLSLLALHLNGVIATAARRSLLRIRLLLRRWLSRWLRRLLLLRLCRRLRLLLRRRWRLLWLGRWKHRLLVGRGLGLPGLSKTAEDKQQDHSKQGKNQIIPQAHSIPS